MRIKKSLRNVFIAILATITVFAASALIYINKLSAEAEDAQPVGFTYYNQLTSEAKRFYNAIADMDEQGMLKQGNAKYDLIANEVLTKGQLDSYSKSNAVMSAFGAARDAYYLDHPEVFYIDFSYLSVSVGLKGGSYVASLGTGRADNYYINGGFKSATEVDAAIESFDAAIDEIVNEANKAEDVYGKIKSVNANLVEKITYSFCVSNSADDVAAAPFIRTSYGALVNGLAVCEGFARSFKCVMDKLGIRCAIVQGYASYEERLEPHAWNYVEIDGSWYGVDVTWNNSTGNTESYLLRGANTMDEEHISDGVISSANFSFEYPLLSKNNYGESKDAIKVEIKDESESAVYYNISYNGKNSTQLKDEGIWLAQRYYSKIGDSFSWGPWTSVYYGTGQYSDGTNNYSQTIITSAAMYVQFGVINYAPDYSTIPGATVNTTYNPATLKDSNFVAISEYYENKGYGTFYGAPYIKETSPDSTKANLDVTKTHHVVITYTQNLKTLDGTDKIGISYTTINADAKKYAEISNVQWDGKDKVSFDFTPSAMYQHRDEVYSFTPTNLVGVDSDKEPMSAMFITKNNNVACNRVYPDGRLYVNTYGHPSLVGSGDLSLNNWEVNGQKVSENQRSQLMLVATKTTEKESKEMLDNIDLPDNAVKSSQTFEIEMNLCKNIVKIPNGSTVQIAFGFPEGYGPDDAGVTFKVYHFHRGDDGKIDYKNPDEIDCIITEYGLIVNISDFSPFAVVAVDKDKAGTVKKSVYARSVGFGGSFEGEVAQLVGEGESVTYTIKPDAGYGVAKVTLNGEAIDVTDNKVTLSYAQLADRNTLEIYYAANSVTEYEKSEGIEVVYPCIDISAEPTHTGGDAGNKGLSPAAIAVIVILCVVAVAAGVVFAIIFVKRKKNSK